MPCPSPSVPADTNVEIRDYLEVHPFRVANRYRPSNRPELVRAVMASGSSSLRALGTLYALSSAADADNVVSTDLLGLHLSQPLRGNRALPAARVRPGIDFLSKIAGDARIADRTFVHVEAGIKIKDLLRDLNAAGLDLPTSGAGGAQSLAGALSTGTHGADFHTPVLADWIRAVHLVSSGGREVWITSANSPFADGNLPAMCADAQVIADDVVLDAVRVGVGRFGAVYAYVLEVLPAYGLVECYTQHVWPEVRAELAVSEAAPMVQSGAFDVPFTDLVSGWLHAEVRHRTLVRYSSLGIEPSTAIDMEYIGGPARMEAPVHASLEPALYRRMLGALGLLPLADHLRGGPPQPLHHMNIAISLTEPDKCWITRRWKAPPTVPRVLETRAGRAPDPIKSVVVDPNNHRRPTALIDPLHQLLTPDSGVIGGTWLPELAACLGISEQAERIFQFRDEDMPRICRQHEQAGATIGEALFMTLYKLATDPVLQPESLRAAAFAVSQLIGGDTVGKFMRAGLASELLDVHDYGLDGAQIGNSAEFFFDMADGAHLAFIDRVTALANANPPVCGYVGMRFMPGTRALLGMPRFATSAAIEVSTPRSRLEDVYAGFWSDVHAIANASGAIAHWGQELRQSEQQIAERYGESFGAWRRALGRVAGRDTTFSTPFSRAHGLEPDLSTPPTSASDDAEFEQFMDGMRAGGD